MCGLLTRRLEILTGGPARSFKLTVFEADMLASALETYAEAQRRQNQLTPPADDLEARADEDLQARIIGLRLRLRRFAGFSR